MSDPVTKAVGGAAAGAMLDKKNPIRGAALGGIGGYFAPGLFGGAAQAAAPVETAVMTPVGAQVAGGNAGLITGSAAQMGSAPVAAAGAAPAAGGMGKFFSPEMMGMNGAMKLMQGQQQQGQQQRPMMMGGGGMPMQASGGSFSQASPYAQGMQPTVGFGLTNRRVLPL